MKLILFTLILLSPLNVLADSATNLVEVEGIISSEPKLYESKDKKYKSYSFKLCSGSKECSYGDQYLLASFKEKKWDQKVGEFKWKKGDKVSFKGKLRKRKQGPAEGGLVGSFDINDYSHKEVFTKLRKPSSFKFMNTGN